MNAPQSVNRSTFICTLQERKIKKETHRKERERIVNVKSKGNKSSSNLLSKFYLLFQNDTNRFDKPILKLPESKCLEEGP